MSIVHKSRSGETVQDVYAPASAEPLMERSATPPPFQILATIPLSEEELEGAELVPEQSDTSQFADDGDAAAGPPADGGGDAAGGDGGSGNAGQGTNTGGDAVGTGDATATGTGNVIATPDLSVLNQDSGGEALPELVQENLKTLTNFDLSGIKVNYNSTKPKLLGAGAYAKGNQIELAAGYEDLLSTALWSIVQQAEGRVASTRSVQGFEVNDDASLASEAQTKGAKVLATKGKLMRVTKSTALEKAQKASPSQNKSPLGESGVQTRSSQGGEDWTDADWAIVPGSFVAFDENGDEIIFEDPELETFTPAIPDGSVVDVEEVDVSQESGFSDLTNRTKSAITTALGITFDLLPTLVFNLNLNFSFNLGIDLSFLGGLLELEGDLIVGAAATVNQQDDRLLRAGWSLSLGVTAEATFFSVFTWAKGFTATFGQVAVYQDLPHFSIHQYNKLREFVTKWRESSDIVRRNLNDLPQAPDIDGRSAVALGEAPAGQVQTFSQEETESLGVPVAGVETTEQKTDIIFTRGEGEDTEMRTALQDDTTSTYSFKLGTSELSLTVADSTIKNHANADNDGTYRNISVSLKNKPNSAHSFGNKFATAVNKAKEMVDTAVAFVAVGRAFPPADMAALWQIFADELGEPEVSPGVAIEEYYTAELNYVEVGDEYALQYLRVLKGNSASVESEIEIPLAGNGAANLGLSVGGSASVDFSATILEIPSSETISYFMTVYNGLVYTDKQISDRFASDQFGAWEAYRTVNVLMVSDLLKNVGSPDTIPCKEVEGYESLDSATVLLASALGYLNGTTELSTAIEDLDDFFYENFQKKQSDAAQPWAPVPLGESTYDITVDRNGGIETDITDFQASQEGVAFTAPKSILESLLLLQDVNVNLTIPTTDWEYNNGSYEISQGTVTKEVEIGRESNQVDAGIKIKDGLHDAWKGISSSRDDDGDNIRIPKSIRDRLFRRGELVTLYQEVDNLVEILHGGRWPHVVDGIELWRDDILYSIEQKVADYFNKAEPELLDISKDILKQRDPNFLDSLNSRPV